MTDPDRLRAGGPLRLLPLLRRRWWLLVLATAAVTASGYFTASTQQQSNSAEAVAVVGDRERSAADAIALAATYAGLIPEDAGVVRSIASRLQLTPKEARKGIAVIKTPGTALLRLRYEADTAERALEGARALARAVHSGSPNLPRGTLNVVRGPAPPERGSPASDTVLLVAGVLVGLFLGGVLMVFLERADARGDHERDLEDTTGLPATRLGKHSSGPQAALVDRWDSLAADRPARVALIPATRRAQGATARVADALQAFASSRSPSRSRVAAGNLDEPSGSHLAENSVQIEAAAGPGREPSGESVALSSDVVVLVARRGDSLRRIDSRFSELRSLGIEVERTLLVPRRLRTPVKVSTAGR